MKIKDIVNRDIVNLQNCESEPIHIPGSIQPHGFLIAIHDQQQSIDFCSGNVADFIGFTHAQLLGKNIDALFTGQSAQPFQDYLTRTASHADIPLKITINEVALECVSHKSGSMIVLEFEKETKEATDSQSIYIQTRRFINHIETSNTLKSLCQNVTDEIRKITGFDRVMVYRFDEQYNGEVFAESRNDAIESFLGLHYPHTDIPAQARELYLKNLLRLITDVNYTPVPVFTIDDGSTKNLDMSHAGLRSVSPIHVQYLQNMGVGATLTISLLHEQKLWGLIACHHYSPKYVSNASKVSAKLQGHFLTSQIRVREANEEYIVSQDVDRSLQVLTAGNMQIDRDTLTELAASPDLLNICHASGVAIMVDDTIYKGGQVPADSDIMSLARWVTGNMNGSPFCTDKLSSVYPAGTTLYDKAAGIIFHSLGGRNSITWFRHETEKEVHWGGDPEKAILKDEKGLHPRKSFALWKEIVKGKSNSWLKPEQNAAENFTHFLGKQLHLMFITEEEARYRALSHKLQEANAELENINWISAHDLKEPLRKIQVFASRILDDDIEIPANIINDVTRMRSAAQRMQLLLYDLISYSRVVKFNDAMTAIDLNEILAKVCGDINEEIEESKGHITTDHLPVVQGHAFLLSQLFQNLLRNALKFRRPGVPPVIHITYSLHNNGKEDSPLPGIKLYHEIDVQDNGIGFKNEYKDSIFDVFTRLNGNDKYEGSGIGLALCKKIMLNHEGAISAEGEEGVGAVFKMYFRG